MDALHTKFISENKLKSSELPAALQKAIEKFNETNQKVSKMKDSQEKTKAETQLLTMDKSILDQLEDFVEEGETTSAAPAKAEGNKPPAKAKAEPVKEEEGGSGWGWFLGFALVGAALLGISYQCGNKK